MNLGEHIAKILLEQDKTTIGIFPGAFKPPHKGHFDVVKKLLQKVDQVVVLVSPKTRDGVTADESVAVWELYKKYLDGSVEIRVAGVTPVGEAYDVVKNNPDTDFVLAFGKNEIDRFKNMIKNPNATIFDAGEVEGVNATGLRDVLKKNDQDKIIKYIPDGVTVEEFLQAINRKAKPEEDKGEEVSLTEYSNKLVQQLTDKFKQEKPSLGVNIIQSYINRFAQIKDSPRVTEKDITKYNWKDLETVVDANQPKRIKAGKINDGEPSKDANLVYNQNGLRIYVGKTKQACVKYGNGYSFCISARGDDNLYHDYRFEQRGTPYFIFDDTKSSEQKEDGSFIDPTHLLVLFVNADERGNLSDYTITTADNPGENYYFPFENIEKEYPRLKGLEKIFKPVEIDPKEEAEHELNLKYNRHLAKINGVYNYPNYNNEEYFFSTIQSANDEFNNIISGKIKPYRITGELKDSINKQNYLTTEVSQIRVAKSDNIEDTIQEFVKNVLKFLYSPIDSNNFDKNHNIRNDWDITYEKLNVDDQYIKEIKDLVDKYRNELSKIRLVKEDLEPKQRLTESETATIGEFIKYACKNLAIQNPPRNLTLSYDTNQVKDRRSFGYFDPNNSKIWVYVKNRNMADILRTLAHELVHHKQNLDGRISYESGKTGSEIENEANAKAGILLRNFGKQNDEIYQ